MTVKNIYSDKLINNATAAASITSNSSLAKPDIPKVTVISEQRKALKKAIFNGEFANAKLSTATKNKLNRINGYLDQLTLLYDTNSF